MLGFNSIRYVKLEYGIMIRGALTVEAADGQHLVVDDGQAGAAAARGQRRGGAPARVVQLEGLGVAHGLGRLAAHHEQRARARGPARARARARGGGGGARGAAQQVQAQRLDQQVLDGHGRAGQRLAARARHQRLARQQRQPHVRQQRAQRAAPLLRAPRPVMLYISICVRTARSREDWISLEKAFTRKGVLADSTLDV